MEIKKIIEIAKQIAENHNEINKGWAGKHATYMKIATTNLITSLETILPLMEERNEKSNN